MKKEPLIPEEINGIIRLIGEEWMLIGTYDAAHARANAMTASWGNVGVLWGEPVCICYVRPGRYTHRLIEETERLSFSFFGGEERFRRALALCGSVSGRDRDKLAEAGLTYVLTDGVPVFDGARLTVIGKKLYTGSLSADGFADVEIMRRHYPEHDLHDFYVCRIESCIYSEIEK